MEVSRTSVILSIFDSDAVLYKILISIALLGVVILTIKATERILKRTNARLESCRGTCIPSLKVQTLEVVSADHVTDLLKGLAKAVRYILLFLLIYLLTPVILSLFPWTRSLISRYMSYIIAPISILFHGIVSFIPNLFFIAVILLVVRYVLKLLRVIFTEIQKGNVAFAGFHRDWAEPTFKLVRFLMIVLTIVMISPYLPGFGSPAFQGISIFFGVLLSLGSTAAIANVVAGVAITYMRPFNIGDRVKIADTMGDVIEKTLLITRIRTIKNVEVTIPNSMVLGSHMINYSALAREYGLIIHTSVTIGYDAPWRKVHELLIDAACLTQDVLKEPSPFVLQTGLNDFSIAYELNAYTANANELLRIQSELHQNIQDTFNEAGVEIMSPTYSAIRDGNQPTIPEDYLPKSQASRGFRILPFDNSTRLPGNGGGSP
jgi:small-conductance mechanosensitive channel